MKKTPYEVLGVALDASLKEIQAAKNELAKKCHPDTSGSHEHTPSYQAVMEAYKVLSDPSEREKLDRELASQNRTKALQNLMRKVAQKQAPAPAKSEPFSFSNAFMQSADTGMGMLFGGLAGALIDEVIKQTSEQAGRA